MALHIEATLLCALELVVAIMEMEARNNSQVPGHIAPFLHFLSFLPKSSMCLLIISLDHRET